MHFKHITSSRSYKMSLLGIFKIPKDDIVMVLDKCWIFKKFMNLESLSTGEFKIRSAREKEIFPIEFICYEKLNISECGQVVQHSCWTDIVC